MHANELTRYWHRKYLAWCERRGLDPDDLFDTGAGPAIRAVREANAKRVAKGKRARPGAYWQSQVKRDVATKMAAKGRVETEHPFPG